nr:hypothetical protein [Tanacetum cinerariifolium]
MDLFNLISALNPSKVKTGLHPRTAHEVALLTATASRVIDMEDPDVATESSGTPSAIEKSPLDFDNKNPSPPMTKGKGTEDQAHETVTLEIYPQEIFLPQELLQKSFEIPTRNVATKEVQDTHSAKSAGSGKSNSSPSMVGSPEAQQVAMGSQLRLRFEQETSNLKTLLEAEADMKKAAEAKNVDLPKELESLRTQFSDLQVSNDLLTQQVSTLQTQLTGEKRIKAAFEELKKYEDDRVEKRCAEMDARLDALSIEADEELYSHILTAIAGRRWVIRHGLRLAVMKCAESIELRQAFANVVSAGIAKGISEGLTYGIKHGKAGRDMEVMEVYDLKANSKYLQALQELKDLKYPMVDQLEGLKDAPIEVRDPRNLWAVKEEVLLEEVIAANVSRAEKKKRCRVVCRTHEVGSAHHAKSDGVPVSVPTVASQGLAILLADAATQTETSEDDASPRLLKSKS